MVPAKTVNQYILNSKLVALELTVHNSSKLVVATVSMYCLLGLARIWIYKILTDLNLITATLSYS